MFYLRLSIAEKEQQMSPTITPIAALAREPGFTEAGFAYALDAEGPFGTALVPFATHTATGKQFAASGDPGTPVTETETWVEV